MSLFSRIEKRAASPSGSKARWDMDVEAPTIAQASGVEVNPSTARRLAAVWACQSLIADGVASLPIDVYAKNGNRRVPVDAPAWLSKPNPFDKTPYPFLHRVMISLVGQDGNAFLNVTRDSRGQIISVWCLDPADVTVDEDSTTPIFTVNGETKTDRDILHIPAFVIPGKRRGISVIDHAREVIGLGLAAEEYGARFFSQGTTLSGVVEHPGYPKPGETAILARMLKKSHSGLKNSHAVGILTGGAQWKSISITPEQAQFLDTRRFQKLDIANLYRVPPHMVDPTVQSSWGSGVEEQNKFFVDFTLIPWLRRLEEALSLLLPDGQYMRFNLDARLRAKTGERFAAYVQAVNNGIMSLDEVREKEDLEPIPGGEGKHHYMPLNLVRLGTDPPAAANASKGGGSAGDRTAGVRDRS